MTWAWEWPRPRLAPVQLVHTLVCTLHAYRYPLCSVPSELEDAGSPRLLPACGAGAGDLSTIELIATEVALGFACIRCTSDRLRHGKNIIEEYARSLLDG